MIADYKLYPCVPRHHDEKSTIWITPDGKYQVFEDHADPNIYYVHEVGPVPPLTDRRGRYRDLGWGDQQFVFDQLGIILYPPGSTPSPEPHTIGSGAYARDVAHRTGKGQENNAVTHLETHKDSIHRTGKWE